MKTAFIIICADSMLCSLVALMGSRRRIGFGWTFLISVLATPVAGLIAASVSDRLPENARRWNCAVPFMILTAMIIVYLIFILP